MAKSKTKLPPSPFQQSVLFASLAVALGGFGVNTHAAASTIVGGAAITAGTNMTQTNATTATATADDATASTTAATTNVTITTDDQSTILNVSDTTALTGTILVADTPASTKTSTINLTVGDNAGAIDLVTHSDTTGVTTINISAAQTASTTNQIIDSSSATGAVTVNLTAGGSAITAGNASAVKAIGADVTLSLASGTTLDSSALGTTGVVTNTTGSIDVVNSGTIDTTAGSIALLTTGAGSGGATVTGGNIKINNAGGFIYGSTNVVATGQADNAAGVGIAGTLTITNNTETAGVLVSQVTGGDGGGNSTGAASNGGAVTIDANSGAIGSISSTATGGSDGGSANDGGSAVGGAITIVSNSASGLTGSITSTAAAAANGAGNGSSGSATGGDIIIVSNAGSITGAITSTTGVATDGETLTAGDVIVSSNTGTISSIDTNSGSGIDGKMVVTNSGTVTNTLTASSVNSADSLTMKGTSLVGGNITGMDSIVVDGGAVATFNGTIVSGGGNDDNITVGSASSGGTVTFNGAIGVSVTGGDSDDKVTLSANHSTIGKTINGGSGNNTLVLNALDRTDVNAPTLKNFSKLEIAGAGTKLAADIVAADDPNGMNITHFTVNTGATGFDSNNKIVDATNVTLKGTLGSALTLGESDQTVILEDSGTLTETIDGGSGQDTLTSRGTSGISNISNFDSLTIESGTLTFNGNAILTGSKKLTLSAGSTLETTKAKTINSTENLFNGTLKGDLTFAAGTNATITVGAGFNTNAANDLIDGESTTDNDILIVNGTVTFVTSGNNQTPQLGAINNIETMITNDSVILSGSVSNVSTFTNHGTLRLTNGSGDYSLDKLENIGTLDISSNGNNPTIKSLSGNGDIYFNGAAEANSPTLTITEDYTHQGDLKVIADATTPNNIVATLTATNSYVQPSGKIIIEALPANQAALDQTTLTLIGDRINLAGAKIIVGKSAAVNTEKFADGETIAIIDASKVNIFTNGSLKQTAFLPFTSLTQNKVTTIIASGASKTVDQVVADRFIAFANQNLDHYSSATTGLTHSNILSNATLTMTQNELDNFMFQVTPDVSGSNTHTVINGLNTFAGANGVLQRRISRLRTHPHVTGVSSGSKVIRHGVWGEFFGGKIDDKGHDEVFGYNANTYGVAFGADSLVGENMAIGFALAYAQSAVDTNVRLQSSNINSYLASLYTGINVDRFFINGNITFGVNEYNYTNQLTGDNAIAQTLAAKYNGNVLSANVATGYNLPLSQELSVTAISSFSYTYVDAEEYTETSSITVGSAAQTINQKPVHAIPAGAGLRLAYHLPLETGSIIPSFQLMAYHQTNTGVDYQTSLAGAVGNPSASGVLIEGVKGARNILSAQLGLKMKFSENWLASASAQYDWGSNSSMHSGSIKARYRF
ncbi:beta strand repeat-containing protein [Piscirickettsia litoralis]|uniref:Autotransporter domain-containing protein n=1 Tax=Piscirickettsia litoralis TaxID=1891921 RepID=A0ABX3A7J1_9GAMM|nr:autotransporter domain-containing protein [Piscirickettsia litoralis]ODN43671.1 hypothetical protein BGC07_13125 [Piscirickettsia litoralis]